MVLLLLKLAGVIAIFQVFLLILFFNSKKYRNTNNKILSLILFVYATQICTVVFMNVFPVKVVTRFHLLPFFFDQFAFLYGPLIWFYSRTIIGEKINKWEWLHVSPFVIMVLYVSIKENIDQNYLFWLSPFRVYSGGLILAQIFIYLLLTGFTVFKKKSLYKKHINKSDIRIFYSFLLVGFILLWALKFNTFLLMDIWKKAGICPYLANFYFIAGFLFLNILIYIALIKPEFFRWRKKYQNNNMTLTEKQQIINELIKNMEIEKIYSDPSLTISILAKKMEISILSLSQIINEEFNKSFPAFINDYRIAEAKRLLLLPYSEYTIQQIMYEVGFNSRSVFIYTFRKYAGRTPSEYRKKTSN